MEPMILHVWLLFKQRLIFLERILLLISDDETLQIDTPCTFNKYNTLQWI